MFLSFSDLRLASSGLSVVLTSLDFKKRPTLRGEISATIPRLTAMRASSVGVQCVTGSSEVA